MTAFDHDDDNRPELFDSESLPGFSYQDLHGLGKSLVQRAKESIRSTPAALPVLVGRKQLSDLKKYNSQLELQYAISTALNSTLKLDNLFMMVLQQVTSHLGYDRAMILLIDRKRRLLVNGRIRGASGRVTRGLKGLEIPMDLQYEVFETVLKRKKSFICNPDNIAAASGLEREMIEFLETKAFAVLPLMVKKRLVGVLWVDFMKIEKVIEREDLRFLEQVASQVAVAIDNAQAYQTITELNASLEAKVQERTRDLERTGLKLKEAFKQLKDLDQFKNRFFTNISHELRTPLTLLLAPLEVLIEKRSHSTEDGQILMTIKENAKQLLKMINALLDLSKINAGKMQMRFCEVDVGKMIRDIISRATPMAQALGISLHVDVREGVLVYLDPDQFIIILQNLITNALNFTQKSGEIEVTLREGKAAVLIEVRDTGPGISNEDLPHIFERFSRGQGGRVEGTGIGLALARELVEMHGGTLKARSVLGSGTVMALELKKGSQHLRPEWVVEETKDIVLPVRAAGIELSQLTHDASSLFPTVIQESPELKARENVLPKEFRVVIAEDHPQMRSYLKFILAERYEVLAVDCGEEAVQIVNKEMPDLILSDVAMSGMSGFDVCEVLKKNPKTKHIPIILLTAHVDPDDVVKGLEGFGADDYIIKPFHARELLARIERLLQVRRMQAQLLQADKLSALGQLSAGLAHEVNNPLGFIKSGISSLKKRMDVLNGDASEAQKQEVFLKVDRVLGNMEEGIERIQGIIRSLKDFSREDSGLFQHVDFRREVDLCVKILEPKIKEKAITLTVDLGDIHLIEARGGQLSQVVMNLLHNAVQAVSAHGIVELKAQLASDRLSVWVKDNGCGISPTNQTKIFHPFFTTKEPGAGLGLGLAICQQIIGAHGGQLKVESKVGEGTIFSFWVPQMKTLQKPQLARQ